MRIAHWLRKEVLMPLLFLVLSGGALYWIYRKLQQMDRLEDWNILSWLLAACLLIYGVLAIMTIRHISTTYVLERYNPGDPRSVRRLMRKFRYRLPAGWNGDGFTRHLTARLERDRFVQEGGDRQSGLVFARTGRLVWNRKRRIDRIILIETALINIFRVDQMLKDCIYQLDRVERKSQRNALIIAVRMDQAADVASAAAGCVNFLGKFQSGSLFPVLIDLNRRRFYFPANRSAVKRTHRFFQDKMLLLIRLTGLGVRPTRQAMEQSEPRLDIVKESEKKQ